MAVCNTAIARILLPGLRMTDEERAAVKAENDRIFAIKAAEERARYNALSPAEKAAYDAETESMLGPGRLRPRK